MDLEKLSELHLIKTYRSNLTTKKEREKIFHHFVYERLRYGICWSEKIKKNISSIENKLNEKINNDIYDKTILLFNKIFECIYDLKSSEPFIVYARRKMDQAIFSGLSLPQLIKLYRTDDDLIKERVFRFILKNEDEKGCNWENKIRKHVELNKAKLKIDWSYDTNDLYEEALSYFHKMLQYWFNVDSPYGLSTYAWRAINCAVNRVFQKITKTQKRYHLNRNSDVEFSDFYDESKVWGDVISCEGHGHFKTNDVKDSFETIFFYKDILEFINNGLVHTEVENSELSQEIFQKLKIGKFKEEDIENLSIKFRKEKIYIIELKDKIESNLERSIFKDYLMIESNNLKSMDLLEKKYNCSRNHLNKHIEKMHKKCRNSLVEINHSAKEIFST